MSTLFLWEINENFGHLSVDKEIKFDNFTTLHNKMHYIIRKSIYGHWTNLKDSAIILQKRTFFADRKLPKYYLKSFKMGATFKGKNLFPN